MIDYVVLYESPCPMINMCDCAPLFLFLLYLYVLCLASRRWSPADCRVAIFVFTYKNLGLS